MMAHALDLYWSFRSPYSYLVTGWVVDLIRDYAVDVTLKIIYPLAIRSPDYYATLPALRRRYFALDAKRQGDFLDIPFGAPDPDPVVMDPQTRRPAANQPYIGRLSRLGIEAVAQGRGLSFIDEVSKIVWSGQIKGWDRGSTLEDAVQRAGLDLAAMERAIAKSPDSYEARLQANQSDLEAAGHWGVPTFVFRDEPFFGQDRFDVLMWRMKQHGLEKRR